MRILRNSILILLSFTMMLILPGLIIAQAAKLTFIKPYETARYFEESQIHQELEAYIKQVLNEELNVFEQEQGKHLMATIVRKGVDQQISSDWISSKMREFQKNVWDFILEEEDSVDPVLIPELRQTFIQIAEAEVNKYAGRIEYPVEFLKADIIAAIEKNVPNELNLLVIYGINLEDLNQAKKYYHVFDRIVYYSEIFVLGTVLLGTLIARVPRRILKWLGFNLIMGGSIALILNTIGFMLDPEFIKSKLNFSGLIGKLDEGVVTLINVIIKDFNIHLLIFSTLSLVIGGLFLFVSSYLNRKAYQQ